MKTYVVKHAEKLKIPSDKLEAPTKEQHKDAKRRLDEGEKQTKESLVGIAIDIPEWVNYAYLRRVDGKWSVEVESNGDNPVRSLENHETLVKYTNVAVNAHETIPVPKSADDMDKWFRQVAWPFIVGPIMDGHVKTSEYCNPLRIASPAINIPEGWKLWSVKGAMYGYFLSRSVERLFLFDEKGLRGYAVIGGKGCLVGNGKCYVRGKGEAEVEMELGLRDRKNAIKRFVDVVAG